MSIERFKMSGSAMMMSFKVSAKEVQKIVSRLEILPAERSGIVGGDSVNVAAVQLLCRHYPSLAEYIVDMNLYVADAVNRRADIVCFPALCGMLPITFLPQFQEFLPTLRAHPETGLPDLDRLSEFLSVFSDVMFDAYYHTMSALAARHRVYIMAGSVLFFEENELCHRAMLFDDQGELVGTQDKISQSKLELGLRIDPAPEIRVFDTPAGAVCILIGSDVDYFETGRIAKALGADIILNPAGFFHEHTPMDTAGGLGLRVQENVLYGVQSTMVGTTGLEFDLEGPCTIYAPQGVTSRRNGVVAQSNGRHEPDLINSTLSFDSLDAVRSPYLHDKNTGLMDKYIDRLY